MQLVLSDLPLPPSINAAYKTVIMNGKLIRCNTKDQSQFKKNIEVYKSIHRDKIKKLKILLAPWYQDCQLFALDLIFVLPKNKIFCLDGRAKKYDTSNRIKGIEDAVSDIIEIDDKAFFKVTAEKVQGRDDESYCIAFLKHIEYNKIEDLKLGDSLSEAITMRGIE